MMVHFPSENTQPGSADSSSGWSGNRARTPSVEVSIGRAITTLREEKGLTQTQVAARIGVTFQAVQRYEKGRARITLSTALALCRAMDVSILRLIALVHMSEATTASSVGTKGEARSAQNPSTQGTENAGE